MNRKPIQSHRDLEVYQLAFEAAMKIFELTKHFSIEGVKSREPRGLSLLLPCSSAPLH